MKAISLGEQSIHVRINKTKHSKENEAKTEMSTFPHVALLRYSNELFKFRDR